MEPKSLNPVSGKLLRPHWIMRSFVRKHREMLFVFGDNVIQKGKKGQALQMRDEPNAIGIPTKYFPSYDENAFYTNDSWDDPKVGKVIIEKFDFIEKKLRSGWDVCISAGGLGTGDAQLATRAPLILDYINARINELAAINP